MLACSGASATMTFMCISDWTLTGIVRVRFARAMATVQAGINLREAIPEWQLRELYVTQALTIEQVAGRFGVGATTIGRRLRELGIRARPRGPDRVSFIRARSTRLDARPRLCRRFDRHRWQSLEEARPDCDHVERYRLARARATTIEAQYRHQTASRWIRDSLSSSRLERPPFV